MAEERFNSLGRFLKRNFGERVHRVNVYLNGESGEKAKYALCPGGSLKRARLDKPEAELAPQLSAAKERVREKFTQGRYIVHLHSYADEFVSLDTLNSVVSTLLQDNDVIGVNITVHIDHIDKELICFLHDTSEYTYLWLVTGLPSTHDASLEQLGFKHSFKYYQELLEGMIAFGFHRSINVTLGIPSEDDAMMAESAQTYSRLPIDGIGIHHYYVAGDSPEQQLFTMQQYITQCCNLIELLPPDVVIRRLFSETDSEAAVLPEWTNSKKEIADGLSEELDKRCTMQGLKNRVYEEQIQREMREEAEKLQKEAEKKQAEQEAKQAAEAANAPPELPEAEEAGDSGDGASAY